MDVTRSRRLGAAFWMVVFAAALGSVVLEAPRLGLFAFAAAVVVSLATVVMSKLSREERVVQPVTYRIVAGVTLVTALAGGTIALMPRASEPSQMLGVFFALTAFLAYRALVARGPRCAMLAVVTAMWLWIPFFAVTVIGRYQRAPHHWSELASTDVLRVLLLLLPVLAIAALLGFTPRRDELPDMRVVR